ncbi:hypothetical protein [Campylobacter coli]|uniref:hypothetical protein n=1 Tax=Campylobacter coli TaxID=195 RepID=UPI001F1612C3|nr:hypothetical protein [Campylobacter coli]
MECILNFINNFKNGTNGFKTLKYNYDQYNCEMSDLNKMINEINIQGIIDFWKQKQEYCFFEMKHPLYNDIVTRAIFSIADHSCNYIFFIDKYNKNIWCAIQGDTVFNKIIVNNIIYEIYPDWRNINFNLLSNIDCEQLKFKDIKFGFRLNSSMSIWHLFYESLCYAYAINISKPIQNHPCLFIPNGKKITNEKLVFFQANCIKDFIGVNKKIFFLEQLGINVYRDSLKLSDNFFREQKYDLVIWLSLVYRDGDAKTWIEQIEAIINIIQKLQNIFCKIKIYIDGIKIYENAKNIYVSTINKVDMFIIKLCNELKNIDIVNLNGYSVKEAICICSHVDVAIAECGSGAIIPVLCCRKPTVLYGNPTYIKQSLPLCIPGDNVRVVDVKHSKYCDKSQDFRWKGMYNYHIPWQHVYNLLAEIIKLVKNVEIDCLEVPSIDLLEEKHNNISEIVKIHSTAKSRIQNQLSYKLGQAMIVNSKSVLGYIRMPFVLSYIKDKHKQEQKIYQEKIKKDPSLKLPPLEDYPDYKEALKLKNHLSYKLGQALIQANKTWYKGGYIKLLFEIRKLKREFCKNK